MHTARSMFVQNRNNSLKQECIPIHQSIDFIYQGSITKYWNLCCFFNLDPGKLPSSQEEMVSQKYGEAHVDTLEKHYGRGNGAIINSVTIKGEWFELRLYLSMHCRTLSMAKVLKLLTTDSTLRLTYPKFVKLAQVCLTLPISTADCERAFSIMHRIKTRLRSEMCNSTLNHCMRISMEGPPLQQFNFNAAVDAWSTLKNRRIFE